MSNQIKKAAVFKAYSANFQLVSSCPYYTWEKSLPADTYGCPICLNFFSGHSLKDTKNNYLTFEHLPPKKLGGKPDILTCQKCNSIHSLSDNELADEIKFLSFMRNDSGATLRSVDLAFGNKRFKTRTKKDGQQITFILKNREELDAISTVFKEKQNFKFGARKASARNVELAILKTGYLLAFKKFGYGLILHTSYNIIREQLCNPQQNILPSIGVIFGMNKVGSFIVKEPGIARALLINFELKIKSGSFFAGLLLPPPSTNVLEYYNNVKPLIDSKTQFTITNIHNQKYLTDKHALFYHFDLKQYL